MLLKGPCFILGKLHTGICGIALNILRCNGSWGGESIEISGKIIAKNSLNLMKKINLQIQKLHKT